MSQLSSLVEGSIGTTIFTHTGLTGGTKARVIWETADWTPLVRTAIVGIERTETQEYVRGGPGASVTGTLDWPIRLMFEWCPDVLRASLDTKYRTLNTTYAASLPMAATDGSGAERVVAFSALRWLGLSWETGRRFGSRTYTGVLATLTSEA